MPRTQAQQKHTNLRKARERKQLSQAKLAMMIQTQTSCISDWERGRRKPQVSKVEILARVLDVDVAKLVSWFS